MTGTSPALPVNAIVAFRRSLIGLMTRIPYWFLALVTRVSIAGVFWQSGQTKMDGWRVSESAIELFRSERRIYGSRTWTRTELETVLALVQATERQRERRRAMPPRPRVGRRLDAPGRRASTSGCIRLM